MRLTIPSLLCFVAATLTGCPSPPAFDITVTNAGDVPTYLDAGEGSGLLLRLDARIQGEWTGLATSLAALCAPRCGLPGAVVCADLAAERLIVHALLPGDSAVKSYDGDFWYLDPSLQCVKKAPMTGPLRATVCHDNEIVDQNGDAVAAPAESGPMDADDFMLSEAFCEEFPFDLEGRSLVVLEVVE